MPEHATEPPFVVAHRAANDLVQLRRAQALGIRLIEGDIHLHRGRLEVRHRRTVGPLPLLWDQWELARAAKNPLLLEHVLEAAVPEAELMLDLKGVDRRLAERVGDVVAPHSGASRVTVCSRCRVHLDALRDVPGLRLVHSIGSRRELRAFFALDAASDGVSVRRTLLDPPTVAALRARTDLVLAWTVEDVRTARRLGELGVHGVIARDFARLAAALGGVPSPRSAPAG